jgi:hypothetical protein
MYISAGYWIGCVAFISIVLMLIGSGIKGHALGILIDPRNKLSLSRLQVVLWTLLIVSAFSALALQTGNMSIYMDPELWALMAISTGSAAGAVIIKSTKAGQTPDPVAIVASAAVKAAAAAPAAVVDPGVGVDPTALPIAPLPLKGVPLGVLCTGIKPRFSDLFKGEEIVDCDSVDISKVQMFFFTIASIVGYAMALAHYDFCQAPAGDVGVGMVAGSTIFFPPISTALVTLIGISHAGYLTVKAAPHTPTA